MMRQRKILNDKTAAPGRFACLPCCSSALAWSCLGWPQGGACVALAALLQGACMTPASQLGSGTSRGASSTVASAWLRRRAAWNHSCGPVSRYLWPLSSCADCLPQNKNCNCNRGSLGAHRGHTSVLPRCCCLAPQSPVPFCTLLTQAYSAQIPEWLGARASTGPECSTSCRELFFAVCPFADGHVPTQLVCSGSILQPQVVQQPACAVRECKAGPCWWEPLDPRAAACDTGQAMAPGRSNMRPWQHMPAASEQQHASAANSGLLLVFSATAGCSTHSLQVLFAETVSGRAMEPHAGARLGAGDAGHQLQCQPA